jgi:hypothetical protein
VIVHVIKVIRLATRHNSVTAFAAAHDVQQTRCLAFIRRACSRHRSVKHESAWHRRQLWRGGRLRVASLDFEAPIRLFTAFLLNCNTADAQYTGIFTSTMSDLSAKRSTRNFDWRIRSGNKSSSCRNFNWLPPLAAYNLTDGCAHFLQTAAAMSDCANILNGVWSQFLKCAD